jgi:Ca2+/H+ antiporter, TMEM165/GDT1 family
VLAMGTTRGWRSTWTGVVAALAALAVVTALAGYALERWLPEALLQLVVGTLLLIFGLQWLRKAILRAAGLKAVHDEDEAFRAGVEAARTASDERRMGLDWFAFVVSFKGVFLEGLEIVFIVITFGINGDSIPLAVLGAGLGGAIVVAAGFALHRPLARVPENTIKFVVGLLLSTFGTFWSVEGLGWFAPGEASLEWPGGDGALPVLLALWALLAWVAVRLLTPRPREAA